MREGAFRRICLIALMSVAVLFGATAREMRFNEGTNDTCEIAWTAPLNARMQLVDLGNQLFALSRRGTELRAPNTEGTLTDGVLTLNAELDGQRVSCRFEQGRLKAIQSPDGVSSRWWDDLHERLICRIDPDRMLARYRWRMVRNGRTRYWDKSGRLRLWFVNPNQAGALLMLVALLMLGVAMTSRGGLSRAAAAVLTLAAFGGVLMTGSRGAIVAFAVGAVAMAVCRWRERGRGLLQYGLIAVLAIGAICLLFGRMRCVSHLLAVDEGNSMRLDIWLAAPRMMLAAPWGWWSNVGFCYCEWFQDLGYDLMFDTLNNAHLTIMVRGGYLLSAVYVFLWVNLLRSLSGVACRHGRVVAVGQWTGLAVAMWFSAVGLVGPSIWTIPVVAAIVHFRRAAWKVLFRPRGVVFSAFVAVTTIGLMAALGWFADRDIPESCRIRKFDGGVRLGEGDARAVVVDDGHVLSGGFTGAMGKELREYVEKVPSTGSVVVVGALDAVPARVEKLVLTGCACSEFVRRYRNGEPVPEAKRLYFVSPDLTSYEIPSALTDYCGLEVIVGEFVVSTWERIAFVPSWLTIVPSAAQYIPDWAKRIGL